MQEEEANLFQVRLNEQGIKFIRKFAAISYTMLVLVFFENFVSIYWSIKMLSADYAGFTSSFYNKVYPYVSIAISIMALVSNGYYLRFPRALLNSIKINDEFGANQAFGLLFRGAVIFFVWLLLVSALMIWNLTQRPFIV